MYEPSLMLETLLSFPGTIVVCVTTGVCVSVVSTPRLPAGEGRLLVSPRSDKLLHKDPRIASLLLCWSISRIVRIMLLLKERLKKIRYKLLPLLFVFVG